MRISLQDELKTNPTLAGFNDALIDAGFSVKTADTYLSIVRRYMETYTEFSEKSADEFIRYYEDKGCTESHVNRVKLSTGFFLDFVSGKDIVRKKERTPRINGSKFKGCNDDCFNCIYPDCYKPTLSCKSPRKHIGAEEDL